MKADSTLVSRVIPAHRNNFTRGRNHPITEICIHHTGGVMHAADVGRTWQKPARHGSSHYAVENDTVMQFVAEKDTAWCNSNWESNSRAVSIEICNESGAPEWRVSEASLNTLIRLVADIAKRNGIKHLERGKNLTWHSMYTATACPGPYLYGKIGWIEQEANKLIQEEETMYMSTKPVRMRIGTMSCGDYAQMKALMREKKIACEEDDEQTEGYLTTVPAVSKGDQPGILALAAKMQVDFEPVFSEAQDAALQDKLAAAERARDDAIRERDRANQTAGKYLKQIEAVKAAVGV